MFKTDLSFKKNKKSIRTYNEQKGREAIHNSVIDHIVPRTYKEQKSREAIHNSVIDHIVPRTYNEQKGREAIHNSVIDNTMHVLSRHVDKNSQWSHQSSCYTVEMKSRRILVRGDE